VWRVAWRQCSRSCPSGAAQAGVSVDENTLCPPPNAVFFKGRKRGRAGDIGRASGTFCGKAPRADRAKCGVSPHCSRNAPMGAAVAPVYRPVGGAGYWGKDRLGTILFPSSTTLRHACQSDGPAAKFLTETYDAPDNYRPSGGLSGTLAGAGRGTALGKLTYSCRTSCPILGVWTRERAALRVTWPIDLFHNRGRGVVPCSIKTWFSVRLMQLDSLSL